MAASVGMQKRTLLDVYYGSFTAPTPDQQAILHQIAAMDENIAPTSLEGLLAQQLFELDIVDVNLPFLVPACDTEGQPWTWDLLGAASFVFFCGEVKCGDVLMAKKIGSHTLLSDKANLGPVVGWALDHPPHRFLVPRLGAGTASPVEKEILAFQKKAREESLGCGVVGGSAGRKGFYSVLDLTGGEHRVSAKAVGVERMALLNGLAREMEPERFKEFLFDLVFEANAFEAKCLEYRDKVMSPTDPNRSLALIPYVTNREVWTNNDRFRAALLGLWSRSSWRTISLLHFRRPGAPAWGREATFEGRLALVDALEAYEMFCRALKGPVFEASMKPIIDLIKRTDNPMRIYDDVYIQYQLEGLLSAYYNEVCKHEGRRSKRFPLQDLVTPADCVAFLGLLVAEFIAAALAPGTHPGEWECSPHHITYGSESLFTVIEKPSDDVPVTHSKSGLCMWYQTSTSAGLRGFITFR